MDCGIMSTFYRLRDQWGRFIEKPFKLWKTYKQAKARVQLSQIKDQGWGPDFKCTCRKEELGSDGEGHWWSFYWPFLHISLNQD